MNLGGTVRINKCGLIVIALLGLLIIFYAYGGSSSESLSASAVVASSPSIITSDKVSLKQLLCAAIDIAQRGGVEVVTVRRTSATLDETVKGTFDVTTSML